MCDSKGVFMSNHPSMMIIAGPNGVGKTTFANNYLKKNERLYLSADLIAYELDSQNPYSRAIDASRLFSERLITALNEKQNIILESTLSGLSLKKYLQIAHGANYQIELVYLFVDTPDLCNKRISERVLNGGHFIPSVDVARRFYRSYHNFWNTYRFLVSSWSLYYNFNRDFETVAGGSQNDYEIFSGDLFRQFQNIQVSS